MPLKLTPPARSRILKSALAYHDSDNHKSQSEIEYFKLIVEKMIVVCYKCKKEIKVGTEYEKNSKYGLSYSRKYYHSACYRSLYQ